MKVTSLRVPGAFPPQQLHLRENIAEKERYKAEQVNTFNGYGTSSYITLYLLEKYNIASKKINFFHYNKQLHSEVLPGS